MSPRFFYYIQITNFAGMRELILYTTVSLDGYIAPVYDGFELINSIPNPEHENYGKQEFYDSIDSVIMGRKTYYELICMDVEMPFKGKNIYVVTQKLLELHKEVHYINENHMDEIQKLKELEGENIWLLGGGILTVSLLEHRLVDKMIINYLPLMIGNGIPLFPKYTGESNWKLTNSQSFKNGILKVEYQLI
ncbi:MAG: dihydrofolate reductase family protein [Paludibacter sp.]|nr:dihydrofolate reductase family protein [Paludibacter sp.]